MPFDQPFPRSFNNSGVRQYAPSLSGVYGISNAGEWIYVGESDNIQAALLGHLTTRDTNVMGRLPTGFVYEICDQASRHGRQDRLVREYEPICNRGLRGAR